MESDCWRLDFTFLVISINRSPSSFKHFDANLDIDLVAAQDDWNILANPLQISMPVGDVLVCDPRGHIEHDDATLSLDIISISETTEFLLASRIPHVEGQITEIGVEFEWVDFDTECSCQKTDE